MTSRIATSCYKTTRRVVRRSEKRPVMSLGARTNRPPTQTTSSFPTTTMFFSTSSDGGTSNKSSPFASTSSSSQSMKRPRRKLKFVPQKAAVALTPKARNFFRALLETNTDPNVVGIMFNYNQSSTGEPRMVFSFDFAKKDQLTEQDEGYDLLFCLCCCCWFRFRVDSCCIVQVC